MSSAPINAAEARDSFSRIRDVSSIVVPFDPASPFVEIAMTTWSPRATYLASVPAHRISRSSGCAPTASTLMRSLPIQFQSMGSLLQVFLSHFAQLRRVLFDGRQIVVDRKTESRAQSRIADTDADIERS